MADLGVLGGVEAGGTTTVCVLGSGPRDVVARDEFPTGDPVETLARAVAFFEGREPSAIGLAWFGPVDLRTASPAFGTMLSTPKPGWSGVDVVSPFRSLGVPVAVDTDVGAAALAEGEWGAASEVARHAYVTIGTGVGCGIVDGGDVVHGLGHPEMGHVAVARLPGDDHPGSCPFHGDCLEGMAAGPAVEARWGRPAHLLTSDDAVAAAALVAGYVAQGLAAIVYLATPERIVVGGGLARLPGLVDEIRRRLVERLGGYPGLAEHGAPGFVQPAALGDLAGPSGALLLARRADEQSPPAAD